MNSYDNMLSKVQRTLILGFVKENYYKKIDEEKITSLVCLSYCYFNRKFKATYGISYREYVKKYRLMVAKKMLKETELDIESISKRVGFHHLSNFTLSFKEENHITPRSYRLKCRRCDKQELEWRSLLI